jgi:hypothetical protein
VTTSVDLAATLVQPSCEDAVDPADFIAIARATTCAEFVERHPFRFLYGLGRLTQADDPLQRTVMQPVRARTTQPLESLVLAVRRAQPGDSERITVGREASNDIVISDSTISKQHAWFRERAGRLDLADAGSRNGTWVGALRLPPNGSPVGTPTGQQLRFGDLSFRLLDAEGLWRQVHGGH